MITKILSRFNENVTKEPYSFLTIDKALPADNPLTDELKILDDKIKANQSQYDLSREAA